MASSCSPLLICGSVDSGSPSVIVSSIAGCLARKSAIASGISVAPADSNAAIRRRPPRRPAIASSSASASARRASTASAWRTSASPASVRRTPRALRCTRIVPVSRSSAAICCETADWVNERDSAAAEKDPWMATSRRTRMRRTSSISEAYSTADDMSLGLMPSAALDRLLSADAQLDVLRRVAALLDVEQRLAGLRAPQLDHDGAAPAGPLADRRHATGGDTNQRGLDGPLLGVLDPHEHRAPSALLELDAHAARVADRRRRPPTEVVALVDGGDAPVQRLCAVVAGGRHLRGVTGVGGRRPLDERAERVVRGDLDAVLLGHRRRRPRERDAAALLHRVDTGGSRYVAGDVLPLRPRPAHVRDAGPEVSPHAPLPDTGAVEGDRRQRRGPRLEGPLRSVDLLHVH